MNHKKVWIFTVSFLLLMLSSNNVLSYSINNTGLEGFYGYVTDEQGAAVNRAIVSFQKYELNDWISTKTDSNGYYELFGDNLEDSYNFAKAEKKAYKDSMDWISIDLTDGKKVEINFTLYENTPPEKPEFSGPQSGLTGEVLTFDIFSFDIDDEYFDFYISWGDYETTHVRDVTDFETRYVDHSYSENGEYKIKAYATDNNYRSMSEFAELYIVIAGNPPSKPIISGPSNGKAGVSYNYSFLSVDPDGSDISYTVYWGDGEKEWSENLNSGEKWMTSHVYQNSGNYLIKAKALDEFGCASEWELFSISIPKNRDFTIINKFMNFLENFRYFISNNF